MQQYNLMVLVFAIITFVKLRQSLESVMLDVFLPVLLLVPAIYFLRIPHITPLSCCDVVLLPLGFATLVCRSHSWRFQRADLWVVGLAVAGFITDCINMDLKTAFYDLVDPGFLGAVLAYVIGKLLIEHTGNREQFAKRLTVLLAAVGFISVSEFIFKHDLFVVVTHRFFGQVDYWGDQYRYGFDRVKGPFLGPEEAGIVFLMGFFLALWLWFLSRHRQNQDERQYLGLRRSTLCCGGILLGLVMTISRGPELGVATGYLIARVGLVKKKHLALIVALVLICSGFVIARQRAVGLEAIADEASLDETQASATYRTRLYEVYKPFAEEGGMFGWSAAKYQKTSANKYPKTAAFFSIDNEYLFLWVTQGRIGLTFFLLIAAEGAIALIRAILRSQQTIDTCFYYCMGGMLTGLLVVLITVYLTAQGYILFFLFSGWIQSLRVDSWPPRSGPQFTFRQIIK
jgi:hypothetical protein